MRSRLRSALLAGAALLLSTAAAQAQWGYYGPRPIVSVSAPGVGVFVGGGRVAVSAPFTDVRVGRGFGTAVYAPGTRVVVGPRPRIRAYPPPRYYRRQARRLYRQGYLPPPNY